MLARVVRTANHYRLDAANRIAVRRWQRREQAWQRIVAGPPTLVTVKSRNGRLTFHSRDSVIGMKLFRERNWEFELIQRTAQLLRQHSLLDRSRGTLIDAGANIGSTTVAFLREGVFRRAIAVEPDALNFQLLEHNVRQNGLAGKVRCHPVALGDTSGSAEFEVAADNFGDHRVRVRATPGAYGEADRRTRTVPIARLDELLDDQGPFAPTSVGLLWIDVQGYEGRVLAGAERLVSLGVPVEMELWPYGLERAGTSKDALLATLTRSFRSVIDLRDPSSRPQPIDAVEGMYARLTGPTADTEVLLFN